MSDHVKALKEINEQRKNLLIKVLNDAWMSHFGTDAELSGLTCAIANGSLVLNNTFVILFMNDDKCIYFEIKHNGTMPEYTVKSRVVQSNADFSPFINEIASVL